MKLLSFISRRVVSRLAAGTGALVIAAAVAAATVPADAAVTSHPGVAAPVTTHGHAQGTANITGVNARNQGSVIICHMVFQGANGGLPHHSGHFPGSINVRVRVTCTKPVASILGFVVLFQISSKGKILRRTPPRKYDSIGRGAANGNAALSCKPGFYEGESVALVTFPPGYTPHQGLLRDFTGVARITKC
jgi:hypothetical protein